MNATNAYIYAALIVAVVLVVLAYAWYQYPGAWSYGKPVLRDGQLVIGLQGFTAGRLRFKNATFKSESPGGGIKSWDVTGTLNSMAAGHDVPSESDTYIHVKGGPNGLSPLSFVLPGWNDDAVVANTGGAAKWNQGRAELTYQIRGI